MPQKHSFEESLNILGIEKYSKRILNSNSKGELSHLQDYIKIAEICKKNVNGFDIWFDALVKYTERNWKRPESVFQHIPRLMGDFIKYLEQRKENKKPNQ